MSLIQVTHVKMVRRYVLEVGFSDGTVRWVNVANVLWGPVFEPLRDPHRFEQVYLDDEIGTVAWSNGADLAPEYLYAQGQSATSGVSS